MPESAKVQGVFSAIAPRYDAANRVISMGMDVGLRRKVVKMVAVTKPQVVVDLATGSGDLAFALRKKLPPETSVTGIDFCEGMLEVARKKQKERAWAMDIRFVRGDCMNLDLPDNSVDALTIGWGLRNFEDRTRGLKEMRRVLKPGGALFCLEFSQPYKWIRAPYYFYLRHMMPLLARIATGNRDSYEYLVGTVSAFPDRDSLAEEMRDAEFSSVKAIPKIFSVIAIHHAVK
jgi:demethylmenaquinone methyltransferase / 2-methoxy-6-polyprenyl-1,4-benzoquinol methylase